MITKKEEEILDTFEWKIFVQYDIIDPMEIRYQQTHSKGKSKKGENVQEKISLYCGK